MNNSTIEVESVESLQSIDYFDDQSDVETFKSGSKTFWKDPKGNFWGNKIHCHCYDDEVRPKGKPKDEEFRVRPEKQRRLLKWEEKGLDLEQLRRKAKTFDWCAYHQEVKEDNMTLMMNSILMHDKCNLVVRIDDKVFKCYREVLQAFSKTAERELSNETLVVFPSSDITPKAFAILYKWILFNMPIERAHLVELLMAAEYLKVEELIQQCWLCIDNTEVFTEDEAFMLYLEAREHGHQAVMTMMMPRIRKFFLTIVSSKQFVSFSPEEVCVFLRSEVIGVNNEIDVFMCGLRWLNFDWDERKKFVLDVMQCVRFGHMQLPQLVKLQRNIGEFGNIVEKVLQSPDVASLIQDGISYAVMEEHCTRHKMDLGDQLHHLKLTPLKQRQWIMDEYWMENFSNPHYEFSYDKFMEYLKYIQSVGKNHWKSLKYVGEDNEDQIVQEFIH